MSYLVSYELEPYFSQMTIREIVEGHSYFALLFNETVTAQVKKIGGFTCILLVRNGQWSEN